MSTIYRIKTEEGIRETEPEVGTWYCGFETVPEWGLDMDGAIAQYVGGGEFYDEGADSQTDMRYYDYLIKQG